MLLNFGAQNFYCFRNGIEVPLELGSHCPIEISKGKNVSNLLCVKGANGSGKTNLIKILSFLKGFCRDSWNQKPDEEISVHSFFRNQEVTNLYCEFIGDGVQYLYELAVTRKSVISEKLSRKKDRYSLLFERKNDRLIKCVNEFSELNEIKLRSNASIISTANQYETKNLKPVYDFFSSIITNVSWYGRYDFPLTVENISKYYNDHPTLLESAIRILKEADLGITDLKILSNKNEDGIEEFFPIFYHDTDIESNFLTFVSESSGTQTIFRIFPYYYFTLITGGILALDEFDKDLHPHILPKIIAIFEDEHLNSKNAQLIFTAHNTEIIDIMGKYRTFIVNKDHSESYGYRLDEIKGELLRNDRPISPLYNKGKIGGVPSI